MENNKSQAEIYREERKARLAKEAEERAELELDNDILDKVIDDTVINLPDSMIEEEFNRQVRGMEAQMKYQGITMEMYAQYMGKSVDDLKADIKASAGRNVKARLVLEKLIKDEKLDNIDADIDNKLSEMAKNMG